MTDPRLPNLLSPVAMAHTLAMALIASSDAPLLLLDDNLVVIAASRSFCLAFGLDADRTAGVELARLGDGEWAAPQLRSLLTSTASGHASVAGYEMAFRQSGRPERRLVLTVKRLDYDERDVRLLLTATDVTAVRAADRAKDNLLREQAVMLEELQHRVANSLQIIASVLMQSATRVQSEETRSHLHNAHSRVMSIAKVQQHLSKTGAADVDLRAYFTALCESIAASMIRDPAHLALVVSSDATQVKPDISISLGLIVTELVINSLKHGFPADRGGIINVDFHADGEDWTLSVSDNGVGMPEIADSTPGLGTGIIEALAGRLDARISISDARPGVKVSLVHGDGAAQRSLSPNESLSRPRFGAAVAAS